MRAIQVTLSQAIFVLIESNFTIEIELNPFRWSLYFDAGSTDIEWLGLDMTFGPVSFEISIMRL